jgi:hypothetical protein
MLSCHEVVPSQRLARPYLHSISMADASQGHCRRKRRSLPWKKGTY